MTVSSGLVRQISATDRSALTQSVIFPLLGEEGGETAKTIASFRNRLLAEHLGVSENEVAEAVADSGSLIQAIDSLREGDRTLIPLEGEIEEKIDQWLPESELLDPEKPIEPEEFLEYFISPESQRPAYRHFLKIFVMIAAVLLLAAIWRWTPLAKYLNIETVTESAQWLEAHPFSPVLVPLAYVVLGLGFISGHLADHGNHNSIRTLVGWVVRAARCNTQCSDDVSAWSCSW